MMQAEQLVRVGFRLASHIAPRHTGRAAFRLFCSPMRSTALSAGERRLAAHMRPLVDTAEQCGIGHPDGTVRAYRWRHRGNRPLGRVMLVHGWTASTLVMAAFVQPLLDRGFEVVALDLPAHGKSSGRLLTLPIGARALQAVADRYGPLTGVITHSIGSSVTLLAMEGGAPLDRRLEIPRMVMIAAPNRLDKVTSSFGDLIGLSHSARSSLDEEILRVARRPLAEFRSDRLLQRTGTEALVIHDEDDEYVDFASAEAIVAANPGARLLATNGLGHRRIIIDGQVVQAATDYLAA